MELSLNGKAVLVTGSTSGIGLGMLEAFGAKGCNLVMNGFGQAAEIKRLQDDLKARFGVQVLYSGADMAKPEEIHQMVGAAEKDFGGVDILINNAGIQNVQPIDEFADSKWNDIIAINLSAGFHTIKAAAPAMKKKRWGRIINIASVHGLVASKFKCAYIAAKHGLVGLTKAAALDLADFGITVNAICPGYVDTPLVRGQIPQQMKEHNLSEQDVIEKVMLKNHAIKRFVDVKDLAALAVFLSSDAAVAMTGQTLTVDGGWTAQ